MSGGVAAVPNPGPSGYGAYTPPEGIAGVGQVIGSMPSSKLAGATISRPKLPDSETTLATSVVVSFRV
jgi:hypothetical protein